MPRSVSPRGGDPPITPRRGASSAKSVIVTGASSGIGRAIAARLAADGFWVLLADVRRDPLTGGVPTDEVIAASGGDSEYLRADVSVREDCERLVARAVEQTGRLDVLVNNAVLAGAHSKPLAETGDGDFDAIMAVNLPTCRSLARAASASSCLPTSRQDRHATRWCDWRQNDSGGLTSWSTTPSWLARTPSRSSKHWTRTGTR